MAVASSDAIFSTNQSHSLGHFLNPLRLLADLWNRRTLIYQFTVREVQGRYKGSYLGVIWAIINPLMMLAVYTYVFHVRSHAKWNPADPNENFMVYAMHMFIRIIAFNVFAESVTRAPMLITSNPNYVKKVVFPLQILVVSLVGAALFHSVLSLAVLGVAVVCGAQQLHLTLIYLPLAYIPLTLFTCGVSWILASLGVFLRDISNVISVLVTLLMFITPIFYPAGNRADGWFNLALHYNPLAMIVDNFGRLVNEGLPMDWREWTQVTALSVLVAVLGYAWFAKIKRAFADVI